MDAILYKEVVFDSDKARHDKLQFHRGDFPPNPDSGKREAAADKSFDPPLAPTSIAESGLNGKFLNALLLKSLHILGLETSAQVAQQLKLAQALAEQLLAGLKQLGLVEVRGSMPGSVPLLRYALTKPGKDQAVEAEHQCAYVGPAPVSLAAFQAQVRKQSIRNERTTLKDLYEALAHLVLPERLIRRLGPAINSGRAMLIYGPPGNGKTSISEAIGRIFRQTISVPHCIEVEGQVIRVFDPTVHPEVEPPKDGPDEAGMNLLRRIPDPRWVKCRRPIILMGGELTIEVLDLQYEQTAKFYEAPPQVKALGGVCIIDDFGRQKVQPTELLNRWIIPLEKGIDFLTIHTGRKFDIPFDEMVIFSTNIPPLKLMDPAQLRRIKYKLRVECPTMVDYALIFRRTCAQYGLELPESVLKFLLEEFYPEKGLNYAGFHPIFFVEHAIAACRYMGVPPRLTLDLVKDALDDLFVTDSSAQDLDASQLMLVKPQVS